MQISWTAPLHEEPEKQPISVEVPTEQARSSFSASLGTPRDEATKTQAWKVFIFLV